jgi:hypothetical protein
MDGDPSYEFNYQNWRAKISETDLHRVREWYTITSPVHFVQRELMREKFSNTPGADEGSRATDVFVFAAGEPKDRHVTKIGGLPYRPADKPWPTDTDNTPMAFWGQFCFSQSKDLVPKLPGEVLLIFGHFGATWNFAFEWYELGMSELVQEEHVPPISSWRRFPARYGLKCRTVDYAFNHATEAFALWTVAMGTKIGGLPRRLPPDKPFSRRLLASLGSLSPAADIEYPWGNTRDPIDYTSYDGPDEFCINDLEVCYVLIDTDGVLSCELQPSLALEFWRSSDGGEWEGGIAVNS